MADLISRAAAIEAAFKGADDWDGGFNPKYLNELPAVDAVPVVRCKDCKHRPIWDDVSEMGGFGLEFPDYHCPCQCDDGYYSRMPEDDWYCANGERKDAEQD